MTKQQRISLLLRLGLALPFFYAAVAAYLAPSSWVGFFPDFLRNTFSDRVVLFGFAIYEAVLGGWLLSGKKTFSAALLASCTLFGIIITNVTLMDVIFRDIGLFFAALALVVMSTDQ